MLQVIFEESGLVATCLDSLESMRQTGDALQAHNGDQTLYTRYEDHLAHWRRLELAIANLHMQLQQVPERWREYNNR